jgi:PEP-CTERM motif
MKDMNKLGIGLIVSAVVLFGANAKAVSIATAEGDPINTAVTLDQNPIITAIGSQGGGYVSPGSGLTYNNWGIFVQDSTGSMDLFGAIHGPTTETPPTVGDTISVQGFTSPFHQIPELGSLTNLTNTGTAAVPTAPVFTIPALTASGTGPIPQNIEGYVLRLQNVTIYTDPAATIPASGAFPNANTSFFLKDSGGNIMQMFFWITSWSADGDMVGTTIPTGPVNITGFVSQSGTFPVELTPLGFSAVPEPSAIALVGVSLAGLLAMRRRRS